MKRIGWGLAVCVVCMTGLARADIVNPYRYESSGRYFNDLLRLKSGEMRVGRILEWGDSVRVYSADGHAATIDAREVDWIRLRRDDVAGRRSAEPDLTVAYVERLPRVSSWQGAVSLRGGYPSIEKDRAAVSRDPNEGDNVTYRVHVLNAGSKVSVPVDCEADIDGTPLGTKVRVPGIGPGLEYVAEFSGRWSADADTLTISIDKGATQVEACRWNNTLREPVHGLATVAVVSRADYVAFQETQNLVDSFCFEDYAQYHIQSLNALMAASVYPEAPEGVRERLRLDRIVVAETLDEAAVRQSLVDDRGHATYDALVVLGANPGAERGTAAGAIDALRVDWSALKRLGLEIGLSDASVDRTRLEECGVYDRFGRPAMVRHRPVGAESLMNEAGPFRLSEIEVAHLNRVVGKPRGLRGTYRYQTPDNVVVEVVGANGAPVAGVIVDVFQLETNASGERRIAGPSGVDPWVSMQTDESGRVALFNRPCAGGQTPDGYAIKPNPFGQIDPDGGNSLLLLRLRQGAGARQAESFRFLPLSTCNLACVRGDTRDFVFRVETQFLDVSGVEMAQSPYAFFVMPDRTTAHPDLSVAWAIPSSVDLSRISEYRLYRRVGFGASDTSPWTLVETVTQPPNAGAANSCPQPYFDAMASHSDAGLDTWFAVAIADRENREGPLSEPTFLPFGRQSHKLAIRDNTAFITLSGSGPAMMLYFNAVAGTQAYKPQTGRFPGYEPHYEGIAFGERGLIVTDPINHVLAVYDIGQERHELIQTIPQRSQWPAPPSFFDGEFNAPADVASDARGNLYVADRGNHRVQILSADGAYRGLLDPDFRFRAPHAIACSNQRICVTDAAGTRVRVYDVSGAEPKFERELPPLVDADRALVTESGQILVTGRTSAAGAWAVLRFAPQGQRVELVETIEEAVMGRVHAPRGLCLHPVDTKLAYFVNGFPFDVRIVRMDGQPSEE
ncbi:MAG TPA: hypothetical protein P5081_10255 [Phycisphaerae bacterium]|nr:hypothetical protein [Phycisphaerae bacterium]HRW53261.1 hypothetical protein [Phycisphaerae bacterium]